MTTQRWPIAWLLTDERMGAALEPAIASAVRKGAGILVRHHNSPPPERRRLCERILSLGGVLGLARDVGMARDLGAAFVHNPKGKAGDLPYSLAVHDAEEAQAAARTAASLVFISPVFATRSHPGAAPLGLEGALALAALARKPAVALGGMDAVRGAALMEQGFAGWAGIDCWLPAGLKNAP